MSGNEYVKFMTEQFTAYIDTPAEEKKLRRTQNKTEPPVYSTKWLGVLPFAFKLLFKKT
ncbi:YqzE family protein [Virgibacillus sp. L01]|uniref:YqzE family protein n=1 Tax=Virgibacillus sp. L01 TaxID=3457429 RepID=UPI003FD5FCC1